jgi:hypothetical protein
MGTPLAWLLNAKPVEFYGMPSNEDDLLLVDIDIDEAKQVVDEFSGKVVIYPHGGAPILTWDGLYEPHPKVLVNLVTSEGHKEVMRRYGYSKPIEVIGWYLCEIKPWAGVKGKKVLFCPIHPIGGGGFMYKEDFRENTRVFKELLDMDLDLSVRYMHALLINGLHKEEGVKYYNTSWFEDLDEYDLVVANGTLACVAIAKGIPTVMLKQDTCTRQPGDAPNNRVVAKYVDKYWDYLKFPYGSEDLEEGMRLAAEVEPVEWKDRFIGKQMDGAWFREYIQSISEA